MQGFTFLTALLALNFWSRKPCREKYLNEQRVEWKIVILAHNHSFLIRGTPTGGVLSDVGRYLMLPQASRSPSQARVNSLLLH